MFRFASFSRLAVAFLVWFALWFVAGRYIGFGFYRFEVSEGVRVDFGLTTLLAVLALVLMPFVRPEPQQSTRWSYLLLCLVLLIIVELAWRLVVSELHWEIGKVLSIALDISTPALLALGVIAAATEWRLSGRAVENRSNC